MGCFICNSQQPDPPTCSKDATSYYLKNKIHSTLALVAENLGELATRRCLCICTAWKPRSPCWLLLSFVLLWPVISKANMSWQVMSLDLTPYVKWFYDSWFGRWEVSQERDSCMLHGDSRCHFWTVNSAFCFFTMLWLLLVHFGERAENMSSLRTQAHLLKTRKVEVLYGEGQDALPYNPLKTYHLLSGLIMPNRDILCK